MLRILFPDQPDLIHQHPHGLGSLLRHLLEKMEKEKHPYNPQTQDNEDSNQNIAPVFRLVDKGIEIDILFGKIPPSGEITAVIHLAVPLHLSGTVLIDGAAGSKTAVGAIYHIPAGSSQNDVVLVLLKEAVPVALLQVGRHTAHIDSIPIQRMNQHILGSLSGKIVNRPVQLPVLSLGIGIGNLVKLPAVQV